MQQKNSGWMDKVSDFVAGKGFYIVLALCAAAIGVSGYVLFFTGGDEEFVDEPLQISGAVNDAVQTPAVQQNEQTEQPAQQQETMPKPADNPSRSDETSEKKKETAAAASAQAPVEQAEQTAAPKAETFISPVQNGQVLREFSGDAVVGGGGSTLAVESKMAPHIHLEVAQDGKLIDPMSILSSAKQ